MPEDPSTAESPSRWPWLRNAKRGSAIVIGSIALVVVLAATIGISVSHAVSPSSQKRSQAAASRVRTVSPALAGKELPKSSIQSSGPTEGLAPTVSIPGGSTTGQGSFNAVTCQSTSTCLAVGADASGNAAVATSDDGGQSWTGDSVPAVTAALNAVDCGDSTQCVAVGQGVIMTSSNDGSTWSQSAVPVANTTLLGVACPSSLTCIAAGVSPIQGQPLTGEILTSQDGGTTWTASDLPPDTDGFGGIACPTTTFCVAVGGSIAVSTDGGQTWTLEGVNDGVGTGVLRSVSCSTATQCIAVAANGVGRISPNVSGLAVETSDAGATWQPVTMPAGTASVDQVACTSGNQCFAGGFDNASGDPASFATSSDGGASWQVQPAPGGLSQIAGLTCPAMNDCVVVGSAGSSSFAVTTANGTTWAATRLAQ